MAGNFIPPPDGDFDTWQGQTVGYITTNLAALGLVAADLAPVTASKAAWDSAFPAHTAAQAAAQAASQAKKDARTAYEAALRPLIQQLQASKIVTDAQRQAMNIPVRSTTRTPVGVPTTQPTATIDTSQHLAHTLDFRDAGSPRSKARPAGVMGCEIWVFIGDTPPADPAGYGFLALDTATPYLAQYPGAQAGKKAHYLLRWVNTTGDKGPWSDAFSATIPG